MDNNTDITMDPKLQMYNALYSEYTELLTKRRDSNSSFSYSRQRCWNACAENILLKEFKDKCMKNEIPQVYWEWVLTRLDEMDRGAEVYSD